MRVSENWLREWVNPAVNTQQLADILTMAGLEVDSIEPAAPAFSGRGSCESLKSNHTYRCKKTSCMRCG